MTVVSFAEGGSICSVMFWLLWVNLSGTRRCCAGEAGGRLLRGSWFCEEQPARGTELLQLTLPGKSSNQPLKREKGGFV